MRGKTLSHLSVLLFSKQIINVIFEWFIHRISSLCGKARFGLSEPGFSEPIFRSCCQFSIVVQPAVNKETGEPKAFFFYESQRFLRANPGLNNKNFPLIRTKRCLEIITFVVFEFQCYR